MKFRSAAKTIAVIALMAALLVAGKFALQFIPNVEVVTLFILVFACAFGILRTLPAVCVFCLLDNLLYPFSVYVTVQYAVHWPLLCLTAGLIAKRTRSEFVFVAVAALFSVFFWVETPLIGWLMQFSVFLPTLISGIPFFIINLVSNCAVVLVLFKPLQKVCLRAKDKLF